jgi:hypothetical protein
MSLVLGRAYTIGWTLRSVSLRTTTGEAQCEATRPTHWIDARPPSISRRSTLKSDTKFLSPISDFPTPGMSLRVIIEWRGAEVNLYRIGVLPRLRVRSAALSGQAIRHK